MPTIVTIEPEGTYDPIYALGPYSYSGNLYVISCNHATSKLMAYRSTDNGATWSNVSDAGPEIYTYSVTVGMTTETRTSLPGAYFDGSLIHCFYYQAAATAADAYVTHCSFNPSGFAWSTPIASAWTTSGSEASPGGRLRACERPAGGIFVGWTEVNSSGGWFRASISQFEAGSFSGQTTIASGTYSNSRMDGLATNTATGGAHAIISVSGSLNHVAMASDLSEGAITFVSGSSGASTFDVRSWMYNGAGYLGVLWTESTRVEASVTPSASISFSSKTVYARNASEESALGFSGTLAPSGGSLHALFWWLATAPVSVNERFRLYKSCLPYTDVAGIWSDAQLVTTQSTSSGTPSLEEPAFFSGSASGSTFRGCYAPGGQQAGTSAGETYLKYISESLASCAGCCCANFAY